MEGMGTGGRIVVFTGMLEGIGTVSEFMDVHGVVCGGILDRDIGKAEEFCLNHGSAVRGIVKFSQAAYLRIFRAASYPGDGLRSVIFQKMNKGQSRSDLLILHSDKFPF